MKQGKSSSISFREAALMGKTILSQHPEVSYEQALAQVKRLKKISNVSSQLKKSRIN
jgi:hypothetical protein